MFLKNRKIRGYSTLTGVVLLLAFLSIVVVSMYAITIDSAQNTISLQQSTANSKYAESCIEEALRRLKDSLNFPGGTLTLADGVNCQVNISGDNTQKTIDAVMSSGDVEQTVTVIVDITTAGEARNFRISSWREQ